MSTVARLIRFCTWTSGNLVASSGALSILRRMPSSYGWLRIGVAVINRMRQSVARRIAETTEKALSGGGYLASSGVTRSWASSIISRVLLSIGSSGVSARRVPSGSAPKPRPAEDGAVSGGPAAASVLGVGGSYEAEEEEDDDARESSESSEALESTSNAASTTPSSSDAASAAARPPASRFDVCLLAGRLHAVIPLSRLASSSNVRRLSCWPMRRSRSAGVIVLAAWSPNSVAVSVLARSSRKFWRSFGGATTSIVRVGSN